MKLSQIEKMVLNKQISESINDNRHFIELKNNLQSDEEYKDNKPVYDAYLHHISHRTTKSLITSLESIPEIHSFVKEHFSFKISVAKYLVNEYMETYITWKTPSQTDILQSIASKTAERDRNDQELSNQIDDDCRYYDSLRN